MNQTLIPQRLVLKRGLLRNSRGQIGALYHKEQLFCHILEDPSRDVKIKGITAIPAGVYDIVWALDHGRSYENEARWHWHERGVFHIIGVPNFSHIQIHPGNTPADTLGCPLPGKWDGRLMSVGQSVKEYKRLYERFKDHAKFNALQIEIIEG